MPKYMNPIGAAGTAVPVTPDFGGPGARMALARKFVYAMLGISVILLLLGVGGFYLLNGQIQSVEKEEADKRAQVGSAQQITSRYDGTLAEYNATNDQLRFLEKPQPENMYVPTMLPQLQALAETYGCQIKSITPGAIAANTPAAASSSSSSGGTPTGPAISYQIMPLAVDITGTYSNLMHFVYDLTEFPKIVTVKSLSLHPGGGNAPPGQKGAEIVDASLGLQTYVFNEDNSATTVPTSMPIGSAPATTNSRANSNVAAFTDP